MNAASATHAVERTALAWRRTGLTAAGTAAVFMTHTLINTQAMGASLIATAIVLGIVVISTVRHFSLGRGQWRRGGKPIALTTAAVTLIALLWAGIDISNLGT
ncbi:DUF202 domain-containing protein [Mycobacteroides franklinii]|uniref:DUF202 domain-containing protein n=1 Tax=Mycobacteroides franklinii TaxID=948102 RepID=A0A4R5P6U5_9MYCO|nr:DUF202 domain-containing protein [Mycobacteroides franklinii]ORA61998.1 hypothetical protein BST24_07485 [Mycobacteroides franklinii]TDH18791.1 DUF202 domain-containing protein [Mycobacteroides franklinii]TDZ46426.1 hypothetical protein CCUG64054_00245 [Mycobacteroides franklinii]TDZ47935.1 hypothetical protein CCUG63697_04229 [Mycobacteroides franklinii]TDZ60144.1 hypothetical protein CCUG63696_00248 [Mycobacteroides franklinii]